MNRLPFLMIVLLMAGASSTWAQGRDDLPGEPVKILVTFTDTEMDHAVGAGAARPGYRRKLSTYLVSVGVKRAASRIARDFSLKTVDEWPIPSLKVHCLVYEVPTGMDVDELLLRLQQRPEVESAQRLNHFEVSAREHQASDTSYAELQHNLKTLELSQAHQWSRGDNTRITIIDTGADLDHPELKGRISSYQDYVEPESGAPHSERHGTAIAGVIGADADNGIGIVGVAPSSRLTVLRACWHVSSRSSAVCNSFTLARALDHAISTDTDIINLSLNGPSDGLLTRLVNQALLQGIVVVAAAPAQGRSGFPAEVEGVITVSSFPHTSAEQAPLASIIRAPGTEILVPVPDGGYDYASGTSLAAAQVSGIVALLLASGSDLTTKEIRSLLFQSQSTSTASVNACRALAELLAETGCREDSLLSAGH